MRHAITFLATCAYVGLVPVAPGTAGSLAAVPLVVGLARLELSPLATVLAVAVISALAMLVCDGAGRQLRDADSSRIVLDEVCGMLVAGALRPVTLSSLALTFVLFRILDVVKPFPARQIDRRMKNGFGVVADDLVAGLYTNLVARTLS